MEVESLLSGILYSQKLTRLRWFQTSMYIFLCESVIKIKKYSLKFIVPFGPCNLSADVWLVSSTIIIF